MATKVAYSRKTYIEGRPPTGGPAVTVTADLNAREAALQAASDLLDLETDAGRAMTQAANADAQVALLPAATSSADGKATAAQITKLNGIEALADVTDEANVTAIHNATAEVTEAPAHWLVLVGAALKRLTHAGFLAVIWAALGGLIAGGTAKATPVDADTIPLSDSAASNATKKLTAANLFAYIVGKLYVWVAALTEKATPVDADSFHLADSVGTASKKLTWANIKAAIKAYADTLYSDLAHQARHRIGGADALPAASDSVSGLVELATAAEVATGTDTGRTPSVATLKASLAETNAWLTKRTKTPDAVTLTYKSDFTSSIDSFVLIGGFAGQALLSYSNGVLRATVDTAKTYIPIQRTVSGLTGKYAVVRLRSSASMTIEIKASGVMKTVTVTPAEQWFIVTTAFDADAIAFYGSGRTAGDWLEVVDIRAAASLATLIPLSQNLRGSLNEEAARIANQLGDTAGVGVAASVTLTGASPISDGDYVEFGGRRFTFKSSSIPNDGDIFIDTPATTWDRLVAAITQTGTFGGTINPYADVHPLVTASHTAASATMTITARNAGKAGNDITAVKSGTNITLSSATLLGGIDDVGRKVIAQVENNIAGSGTRPAAAKIDLANTALIGYEKATDVAAGGTVVLPAGGTWIWFVYGHGATISSAKSGTSAGGTTLTVAGANATVWQRRTA